MGFSISQPPSGCARCFFAGQKPVGQMTFASAIRIGSIQYACKGAAAVRNKPTYKFPAINTRIDDEDEDDEEGERRKGARAKIFGGPQRG